MVYNYLTSEDSDMSTPTSTQLQIASDSGFSNILVNKSGSYSTNINISDSDFSVTPPKNTTLYSRVKHSGTSGDSAWSSVVNFTIKELFSTITATTPVQCNSHDSHYISTTLLSSDRVLVCYRNNSHSGYLYSLVLTVSGTNITASTPVQCNSHDSYGWVNFDPVLFPNGNVLVCYSVLSNYYMHALILQG